MPRRKRISGLCRYQREIPIIDPIVATNIIAKLIFIRAKNPGRRLFGNIDAASTLDEGMGSSRWNIAKFFGRSIRPADLDIS